MIVSINFVGSVPSHHTALVQMDTRPYQDPNILQNVVFLPNSANILHFLLLLLRLLLSFPLLLNNLDLSIGSSSIMRL